MWGTQRWTGCANICVMVVDVVVVSVVVVAVMVVRVVFCCPSYRGGSGGRVAAVSLLLFAIVRFSLRINRYLGHIPPIDRFQSK